ncbi:MAG: MTH1187 family thiamine-binding protein [Acidobacteria bacterium]|nr:MTH1187 family thiamine-binding protein [Acidobacteriota bacterium]
MKALAEIQVIPIGVGTSVRGQVRRAHQIIRDSGLKVQLHAYGTNVEGDLDTILETVGRIHTLLHAEGVPRLSTAVKIGTRTDKDSTLEDKVLGIAPETQG